MTVVYYLNLYQNKKVILFKLKKYWSNSPSKNQFRIKINLVFLRQYLFYRIVYWTMIRSFLCFCTFRFRQITIAENEFKTANHFNMRRITQLLFLANFSQTPQNVWRPEVDKVGQTVVVVDINDYWNCFCRIYGPNVRILLNKHEKTEKTGPAFLKTRWALY